VLLETDAIKNPMLDAGYLMLDNLHAIYSGVDRHPVSRNQYQESASDSMVIFDTAW